MRQPDAGGLLDKIPDLPAVPARCSCRIGCGGRPRRGKDHLSDLSHNHAPSRVTSRAPFSPDQSLTAVAILPHGRHPDPPRLQTAPPQATRKPRLFRRPHRLLDALSSTRPVSTYSFVRTSGTSPSLLSVRGDKVLGSTTTITSSFLGLLDTPRPPLCCSLRGVHLRPTGLGELLRSPTKVGDGKLTCI